MGGDAAVGEVKAEGGAAELGVEEEDRLLLPHRQLLGGGEGRAVRGTAHEVVQEVAGRRGETAAADPHAPPGLQVEAGHGAARGGEEVHQHWRGGRGHDAAAGAATCGGDGSWSVLVPCEGEGQARDHPRVVAGLLQLRLLLLLVLRLLLGRAACVLGQHVNDARGGPVAPGQVRGGEEDDLSRRQAERQVVQVRAQGDAAHCGALDVAAAGQDGGSAVEDLKLVHAHRLAAVVEAIELPQAHTGRGSRGLAQRGRRGVRRADLPGSGLARGPRTATAPSLSRWEVSVPASRRRSLASAAMMRDSARVSASRGSTPSPTVTSTLCSRDTAIHDTLISCGLNRRVAPAGSRKVTPPDASPKMRLAGPAAAQVMSRAWSAAAEGRTVRVCAEARPNSRCTARRPHGGGHGGWRSSHLDCRVRCTRPGLVEHLLLEKAKLLPLVHPEQGVGRK